MKKNIFAQYRLGLFIFWFAIGLMLLSLSSLTAQDAKGVNDKSADEVGKTKANKTSVKDTEEGTSSDPFSDLLGKKQEEINRWLQSMVDQERALKALETKLQNNNEALSQRERELRRLSDLLAQEQADFTQQQDDLQKQWQDLQSQRDALQRTQDTKVHNTPVNELIQSLENANAEIDELKETLELERRHNLQNSPRLQKEQSPQISQRPQSSDVQRAPSTPTNAVDENITSDDVVSAPLMDVTNNLPSNITADVKAQWEKEDLDTEPQVVYVHQNVSTHFISPEPFDYVDFSTEFVTGNLISESVVHIRPVSGAQNNSSLGSVTLHGDGFFREYTLKYTTDPIVAHKKIQVNVHGSGFKTTSTKISKEEVYKILTSLQNGKRRMRAVAVKARRLKAGLNNIYSHGGFLFVDFELINRSHSTYQIERVEYTLMDRSQKRYVNQQRTPLKRVSQVNFDEEFERRYRQIVVFEKFTTDKDKVLAIRVYEKGLKGRQIELIIRRGDLLRARPIDKYKAKKV